ncbi:MAG: UTRA domain-containing protein [Hyphomicrobiales bacterium]
MRVSRSWQGIKTEVERRIAERIWQPGDMIPNEATLAKEFGCARATVNRALQALSDEGMLDRKRKAGTRVALNRVAKATLDISVTRLDVEQRGAVYSHKVLEQKTAVPPKLILSRFGLGSDTTLLHLRSLHLSDGNPFLYEDRWINPNSVSGIESVDFHQMSANEWLVQNVPFTTGDISFSADNANSEEAKILDARVGAAIFIVNRTTWDGRNPITSVRLAYAPGFKMRTTI